MLLRLRGEVKQAVSFEPGGYVSLWGAPGSVQKEELLLMNHRNRPLRILGSHSDLPERIHWQIVDVKPGFVFRIIIEDAMQSPGDYTGHLLIQTDSSLKPELTVIVSGHVRAR